MDALWTPQYYQKVLALDPIAYWMLDEKSGTVAYDMVSGRVAGAQNGAHTGVTLGQPGIGDGRATPLYDGVTDYTNVYSAALSAAFNGDEGTVLLWARVEAAGDWTDGVRREAIRIIDATDFQEIIWLGKSNGANGWVFRYAAGGVVEDISVASGATIGWALLGITWDVNAGVSGEVKAYLNGVQAGATQVALGAWVGPINTAVIGAGTLVPDNAWKGNLGHCALWDRALILAEVASVNVAR